MPQLTTQKASTRPDIAESMMEFDLIANNAKMIGMELFPVFDAASQAGEFGRIPIEQLLEESKTSRASGSSYGRGEYEFEDDFYATKENGWEEPVDERDKNIYSEYFDAEVVAAERALSKIMINQEKRVSDLTISNASITGSAATAVYSNKSAATPIDDVETAVQAIYDRTGVWPDTLCLSYKLFRYLRQTDQVLNNISASGAGDRIRARDITTQMLAEVFDLDKILIAGGSRNTAAKGQDVAVAQIWDKTRMFVCKSADGMDLKDPCIGRTFHWSQDGSTIGGTVESYWEENKRSDIYRVRHETHEKLIYAELGQRITGCLA